MSIRNKAAGIGLAAAISAATPFIAVHEGLSLKAYLDPVLIPTICYGETVGVRLGQMHTKHECDIMLAMNLTRYATRVDELVKTPMTPNRHAALISFSYNVGLKAFEGSTVLKRLNAGDPKACDSLRNWVYAKGKKLKGLVTRRENERTLCNS